MSDGNNGAGSDDEQQRREPAFNWGLIPSEPAPEVPGLLKLPPVDAADAADDAAAADLPKSPEVPERPELPELVVPSEPTEPPATEVFSAADLPTGLMDIADIPPSKNDISDVATQAINSADLPTAAMSAAELPTAAMDLPPRQDLRMPAAVDSELEGATQVLGAQPVSPAGPEDESVEHDSVSALFGEENFVEYEEPQRGALVPAVITRPRVPQPPRPPIPRGQLIALSIAGGLVAALALTALFLAGTRLAPTVVPVAVPTPTATATAAAVPSVGPLPVGSYTWDELLGGECLDPFESAWQNEYTVIECAQPHAAQLVMHGQFDDAVSEPFPETEVLLTRTATACSTDTVLNFEAAKSFADLELMASFAPTASEWNAGQRDYYCFATRSSGEALTQSVAQPQAAAPAESEGE